ncbi:hypothetical protein B0G71_2403 [Paraburkholderia sp. BL27I4N3]|uniref:hypothetical protein n=1 Tax=Paraburkholderia sp. BL27I4N3 TaxID=1938805 RepID=UPI000E24A993|nr:hypothetical protein [Paraburkholderia sp. BL27I4N3]REE19319.1 hypothetical protein B0G71_2403 [Paraburkholderia sp. BL27I4N3]
MKAGSTTIAALAAVVLSGLVYVNCPQIRSLCAEGKTLDLALCAASKIQVACKTEGSNSGPTFASSLFDAVPVERAGPVVSSLSCFTQAMVSRATRQTGDVDFDAVDAAIFDLSRKVAISACNNRDCMQTTPLQ